MVDSGGHSLDVSHMHCQGAHSSPSDSYDAMTAPKSRHAGQRVHATHLQLPFNHKPRCERAVSSSLALRVMSVSDNPANPANTYWVSEHESLLM